LQVKQALPSLARLIYSTDTEVLTDALWALSYLFDGSNVRIENIIEAGITRRVVELLLYENSPTPLSLSFFFIYYYYLSIFVIMIELQYRHSSPKVAVPALRVVGNIAFGDDLHTQVKSNKKSKIH
jgi:importin subunit alpha-1